MRPRSAITPRAERQLAAVVAADIAGYSRLMGADDADWHQIMAPGITKEKILQTV